MDSGVMEIPGMERDVRRMRRSGVHREGDRFDLLLYMEMNPAIAMPRFTSFEYLANRLSLIAKFQFVAINRARRWAVF
jgi:hypothetical protein